MPAGRQALAETPIKPKEVTDASWQSAFGGNRYKTGHGSHGCINLPEDQAALIYNTIDGGYPIIIY